MSQPKPRFLATIQQRIGAAMVALVVMILAVTGFAVVIAEQRISTFKSSDGQSYRYLVVPVRDQEKKMRIL